MSCNNCDSDSDVSIKSEKKNKPKYKCEDQCEDDHFRESIDLQNIKSVLRMNDYLKRLFYSYNSICEILSEFLEQIYCIYNDLNFQSVDPEIIESYNKAILFMYESIAGVLTDSISGIDYIETQLIKPVESNYKTHKINLTYFIDDSSSLSRFLGTVSNVSITLINDQLTLDRAETSYIFTKMNLNNTILVNDFRYHLDTYTYQTKRLIGFFYKDVEYVKNAIRTLLTIISETITIQTSKKYIKKWTCVVEEVGNSITLIKKCNSNITKC